MSAQHPSDTPRKVCIFCGGTPVTKEHVFGDSLRSHVTAGRVTSTDFLTGQDVSDLRSPFDVTLRRVCARCNNGWMNRVDQAARQPLVKLIDGDRTTLSRSSVTAIASAIGKIALLRSFVQVEKPPISTRDIAQMYTSHRTPPLWRIWIGHIDHLAFTDRYHYFSPAVVDVNDRHASDAEMLAQVPHDELEHLFSYLLGLDQFFALVVGSNNPSGLRHALVSAFEKTIAVHRIPLVSVWPTSPKAIDWPHGAPITSDRIALLSRVLPDFRAALMQL